MPAESDSSKPVPMQVRLDPELHAKVKDLAEQTDISVNQLVQGVLRWAVENAVHGEPEIRPGFQFVNRREVPGCVFFGRTGTWTREDPEDERTERVGDYGCVFFGLDFSGRGLVRTEHLPGAPDAS
ncbi:toxin-antitoxin system HicB family antitoxin [Alienimonas chondri]|uniref:Uncharacterized protein n=1 Tax=Alienimonas chondri TaxID=2681879 RepID=A0ABX1VFY9_9PLAN|nr:toxin-antitoxin system HicB family antitoxin [Alienimonas chondri]NNJ26790.1 hypothetical protein [Alienimonas chondri]